MPEVFKILSSGTFQLGTGSGNITTVDDAVYVRLSNMSTSGNYVIEVRDTQFGSAVQAFRIAPLETVTIKKLPSQFVYGASGNIYVASVAPNP